MAPYQGGKRKFARAILEAAGLRSGQGAERVVLCDAGPWGDVWRHQAAGVDLAALMEPWAALGDDAQRAAFGELRTRWPEIEEPEQSAAWLWLLQRSYAGKGPRAGFLPRRITKGPRSNHGKWRYTPDAPAPALRRLDGLPWPARTTVLRCDARLVEPISDAIVYIDPPYAGTTGYAADLDRAAVLELALRWHRSGARVIVSEQEPLPLGGDWHSVEITATRSGTSRTWAKQQREWLTLNFPPHLRLGSQEPLFG